MKRLDRRISSWELHRGLVYLVVSSMSIPKLGLYPSPKSTLLQSPRTNAGRPSKHPPRPIHCARNPTSTCKPLSLPTANRKPPTDKRDPQNRLAPNPPRIHGNRNRQLSFPLLSTTSRPPTSSSPLPPATLIPEINYASTSSFQAWPAGPHLAANRCRLLPAPIHQWPRRRHCPAGTFQ